ncbi:alpha/beta fold hydrolase [Yinghuangia sp. ASG 101]|uniref:alpha/beta hydrolase n=1 Tax=Yinghuangia sp. ASG 101 TaxID=2896848 RepID=UPI001E4FB2BE|nr:alpha/beta fold hydrolase [Yinghuangia sp. ASG 101]UGQ11822.1 alpha/beta fold hydrolase [Yinghuangia sp. ASG 101]
MTSAHGHGPFFSPGGRSGVVLAHGFTGTPHNIRPWADHLAEAGHTVALPLLPGHGTRWEDLEATRWTDWYGGVESAFTDLLGRCDRVFACGFSMGGALALHLAATHPRDVAGLILVNPSVGTRSPGPRLLGRAPVIARVKRTSHGIGGDVSKPGVVTAGYDHVPVRAAYQLTRLWRTVRGELGRVAAPTLLFRSATDHVVDGRSAELIRAGLRHAELREETLHASYHIAPLDHDAEHVFAGTVEWIRAHERPEARH